MTQRTFTDKNGNEWTWEENAEVLEALKQLHQQQQVPDTGSNNSLV
jgi:hypothetical protein